MSQILKGVNEGNLRSPRPAAIRKDAVQSFPPVGLKLDSKSGRNYAEAYLILKGLNVDVETSMV